MKTILKKTGFIAGIIVFMGTSAVWGQKKTKTFHENFNVSDEVVLEVNTSYADIEFETWNKDQVDILAVVELEDVSEEEADRYFKREPVKIVGNSKNISISTVSGHREFLAYNTEDIDIDIDFLDQINGAEGAHTIAPLVELPELPEMMEMPPLPPMNIKPFDYEAYKKDGEAYLKEWKKEFDKGFGKDYERKMEEWSRRMDIKHAEIDNRRKEIEKKREQAHQDRLQRLREMQSQRMEIKNDRKAIAIKVDSAKGRSSEIIVLDLDHQKAPNVFYSIKKGGDKNLKVKKTIKIKLPKSTKIKMNVRHGEVIWPKTQRI
ncbi:MAG: hypothetical protein R2814_11885 [Flavobacteriaceae bacterium]